MNSYLIEQSRFRGGISKRYFWLWITVDAAQNQQRVYRDGTVLGLIQCKHHQGFRFLPGLLPAFLSTLTLTSAFSFTVIRSLPYPCPQHQCEGCAPVSLAKEKHFSDAPTAAAPASPSGLTDEIRHMLCPWWIHDWSPSADGSSRVPLEAGLLAGLWHWAGMGRAVGG